MLGFAFTGLTYFRLTKSEECRGKKKWFIVSSVLVELIYWDFLVFMNWELSFGWFDLLRFTCVYLGNLILTCVLKIDKNGLVYIWMTDWNIQAVIVWLIAQNIENDLQRVPGYPVTDLCSEFPFSDQTLWYRSLASSVVT